MVRRIILVAAATSVLVAAILSAQGCVIGTTNFGGNCDLDIPIDCCQCVWPEDCPPYRKEPARKIPEWCAPYLIDAGCPDYYTYDRSFCENAADAGSDADDAGNLDDAGDGGLGFCSSGTCVPPAPQAWKHVAFAMTWPALPPACPEDAPSIEFEGSPAPPDRSCPTCSCSEPEGKCILPTTWTVSSAACPGDNGVKTNFDPPSGWDGTCSPDSAIALGKLCGSVPCVRSITISPPVIEEKPCTPHSANDTELPVIKAWSDGPATPIGRACLSNMPLPSCPSKGCGTTNSEFGACILQYGDHACPEGWNGDRHVLYAKIEDARECTPCACEAPTGGSCQVKFRTFAEASCSAENAANDIYTGMTPACHDYMPGVALAAKSAEIIDYKKGSCAPTGGELVGALNLEKQATVCCFSSAM